MSRTCETPWTLQDAVKALTDLYLQAKPTPPQCLAYDPDSPNKCSYACKNVNNTVLQLGLGFRQQVLSGVRGIQDWLLTKGSVVASIQVSIPLRVCGCSKSMGQGLFFAQGTCGLEARCTRADKVSSRQKHGEWHDLSIIGIVVPLATFGGLNATLSLSTLVEWGAADLLGVR